MIDNRVLLEREMPVRNLRHYEEEFDYIEQLNKPEEKPLLRTMLLKLNLHLN